MFTRSFTAVLIVSVCFGCRGLARRAECKRVADATSTALSEIAKLDSSNENAPVPENYTTIAERYRQLDKELEAMEPSLTTDFKLSVTTYRGHLRTGAREVERYRDALVNRAAAGDADPKGVSAAEVTLKATRERMAKTGRAYDSALERMEVACAPRD